MSPSHHPARDLLLAYAAGTLPEAAGLAVATHLALCPLCRAEVRRLEALGGTLLEQETTAPVSDGLLDAILAQIEEPAPLTLPLLGPRQRASADGPALPEPLRSYVGGDLDGVQWKPVVRGLDEAPVRVGGAAATEAATGGTRVRLMRVRSGVAMPRHTHHGTEMTLVLAGGFSDQTGHYLRGDFTLTDTSIDHQPTADPDGDCICLAVTDAPLRLTGPLGRLLNPFVRF